MALSPREMEVAMLANLKEKTGRDADEWSALLAPRADEPEKVLIAWLKTEHRVGHFTARMLVERLSTRSRYEDPAALRAALFARAPGQLAALDAVVAAARALDPAVEVVDCATYVGLRLRRQFAVARPTAEGLEVSLALPDAAAAGLAPATFRGGGRMTHRVVLPAADAAPLAAPLRAALAASG